MSVRWVIVLLLVVALAATGAFVLRRHGQNFLTPRRRTVLGVTAALEAELTSCGDPVSVSLTISPTAESWIDNSQKLGETVRVRVAVPDVGLTEVSAGTRQ